MNYLNKQALISHDKKYRYILTRMWDNDLPSCVLIGLNPSTADEEIDDPTIRRCVGFAKVFGYGKIYMLNLFAFRSTNPKFLRIEKDPVGPENDKIIKYMSKKSDLVIAAWGALGAYKERDREIAELVPGMKCLGKTKQGMPKHPLYLDSMTKLVSFN